MNRIPTYSFNELLKNNLKLYEEFSNKLNNYISSKPQFNDDAFRYPLDKFNDLIYYGFGSCYKKLINNKINSVFADNLNKLNNINSNSFEISFNGNHFINENGSLVFNKSSFNGNDFIRNMKMSDDNSIVFSIDFDSDFINIKLDYLMWMTLYGDNESVSLANVIYIMVVDGILKKLKRNSYYLPASGNEILNDMNRYMSNELKGTINVSTIEKELVTNILSLKEYVDKGYYYDLAKEFENELIGGDIIIKNNGVKEELFFVDRDNNLELDLKLVSSSIRELIPLILYLKYFLKKDDILIIEEPENHLHPRNQMILVKYFVKAINNGLNIVLTTHSDFILEKFDNFVRLGNSSEELFEKLGYDKSNILNYDDVNIYNFKKDSNYSYISEKIEVNFTGFDENNFSEVISELYDETVDIIDAKIR